MKVDFFAQSLWSCLTLRVAPETFVCFILLIWNAENAESTLKGFLNCKVPGHQLLLIVSVVSLFILFLKENG